MRFPSFPRLVCMLSFIYYSGMEKAVFRAALIGLCALWCNGCNLLTEKSSSSSSSNTGYDIATATKLQEERYESGVPIAVASETLQLSISGDIGGKTLYFAKTNPTETLIETDHTRYVAAADNLTFNDVPASENRTAAAPSADTDSFAYGGCGFSARNKQFLRHTQEQRLARAATTGSATAIDRTHSQLALTVGETTKQLYVDTTAIGTLSSSYAGNADGSYFVQQTMTLRALGTYCNVWVASDSYTDGSKAHSGKITREIAQKMADFFDDVYSLETHLYGAESDSIFYATSSFSKMSDFALRDMATLSDTGTKVNLVVFDIPDEDTLGYFWAKDYFPNLADLNTLTGRSYTSAVYGTSSYSNEGKYLYIDAPSCVDDIANVMTIVTHEYQHLITWGRKTMNHYADYGFLDADAAYYEMMAMVGEDFIKEYSKQHYADDGFTNDSTPLAWRLPTFNAAYFRSGAELREDSSGAYTGYSYATNYAFGAWLARKHGGAAMMNHIVNSTDTDYFTAIAHSVHATTGETVTIASLLRDFAYDCIVSEAVSGTNGFMRENKLSAGDPLYNTEKSYGYPLTAVDLWQLKDYISATTTTHTIFGGKRTNTIEGLTGPYLFAANYASADGVRPYGMELQKVGTIASGATSLTLQFNAKSASSLKSYVIIE